MRLGVVSENGGSCERSVFCLREMRYRSFSGSPESPYSEAVVTLLASYGGFFSHTAHSRRFRQQKRRRFILSNMVLTSPRAVFSIFGLRYRLLSAPPHSDSRTNGDGVELFKLPISFSSSPESPYFRTVRDSFRNQISKRSQFCVLSVFRDVRRFRTTDPPCTNSPPP